MSGRIVIHPIFFEEYIVAYISDSFGYGYLKIFEYIKSDRRLNEIRDQSVYYELSNDYNKYSLVLLGKEEGILLKRDGSSLLERFETKDKTFARS